MLLQYVEKYKQLQPLLLGAFCRKQTDMTGLFKKTMPAIITGLQSFSQNPPAGLKDRRLGLLCNPASVDNQLRHARHIVARMFPTGLKALFSPQHGFFGEKQDNMIESDDFFDQHLNVPVFSLYGATRKPTSEMIDQIDTLLVDLQDAGARVYTFFTTLSYCMEKAAEKQKSVVILDRPNPVGGLQVEGNCLDKKYASFVGRYPIPMRHGLTIGEYAQLINSEFSIGCDLKVIPMQGWKRWMYYFDTGLLWIPPSPNLPTPVSAMVYPGQVIWEGTNVSEGRGTTQPFEIFGAPWIKTCEIEKLLGSHPFDGVVLRPVVFEPTSGKWAGQSCHGFQIHVTCREKYNSYKTSLILLAAIREIFSRKFAWKPPPYEYEWEKLPFDLIAGGSRVRLQMESGQGVEQMARKWEPELQAFKELVRPYLLYEQA